MMHARTSHGYGKIIVAGEHAVVYGHPALAAALPQAVQLTVGEDAPQLHLPAWQLHVDLHADHPVAHAVRAIWEGSSEPLPALVGQADLPARAGLGSSAALCVAVAKLAFPDGNLATLTAAAQRGEQIFHHAASGVDVALALRGGVGIFCRGEGLTPLTLPPLTLAVGQTGVARDTKTLVAHVQQAIRAHADDPRLIQIADATQAMREAWAHNAPQTMGRLANTLHETLRDLGVSGRAIETMRDLALAAGAWGCKLTGAGGGGSVIAVGPSPSMIVKAWHAHGYAAFTTTVGSPT